MDSLEYIDNYFKGELNEEETILFEQKIINDRDFADEVAYYISAHDAIKEKEIEEKKIRFREIYDQNKPGKLVMTVRKIWPSIAAAAVIAGIIFGWQLFTQPISPKQLADRYMQENLQKLPISMGSKEDSMQKALKLYNDQKLPEALQYFQSMIQRDTADYISRQNAGIVALRLQRYDLALDYFKQLESYSLNFANPALFYEALTLMKRNRTGDAEQAKKLLQQVVQNDLDYKEVAEEFLKKL